MVTDLQPMDRAEMTGIAQELARAFQERMDWLIKTASLTPVEAAEKAREYWASDAEQLRQAPSDQISWNRFGLVMEQEPETALEVWERVKAEAAYELATGYRAARALEYSSSPWTRAQFVAIRNALISAWQPRDGLEQMLVDTLAQCQTLFWSWLEIHQMQVALESQEEDYKAKKEGYWLPPRISRAEAIDESATMAERWNRLFVRTLRALRDLRRYGPSVLVNQGGQVNIGAQQTNVSGPSTATEPASPVDCVPA